VNLDVLILVAGGAIAILSAGLVLALSPARYPSLVAAGSLAALGVLQFGWARAASPIMGGENRIWFELSLAFAVIVSLLWLLLSRTIGLGPRPNPIGLWRYYILAQSLCAAAAVARVALEPTYEQVTEVGGGLAYGLGPFTTLLIVAQLLNLILLTASFESTYFALPASPRRAFLPGLIGILAWTGYFTYVSIQSLILGSVNVGDLSTGAFAVIDIAVLLPISLIRGRLGEAHVRRDPRPLARTMSVGFTLAFLLATTGLLWIAHATGWSLARSLWIVIGLLGALGLAALMISNRVQRRVQRWIDPYLYGGALDRHGIERRADEMLAVSRSAADVHSVIPSTTEEIVGARPVTLFLASNEGTRFIVAASTIAPAPPVWVDVEAPLAIELRRAGRAIRLRGRPDDLEYIPIYVENAAQLEACDAVCAAPLLVDEEMAGFLLCGERGSDPTSRRQLLPLLDVLCSRYSEALTRVSFRAASSEPRAVDI
jgi:hypothetical protein